MTPESEIIKYYLECGTVLDTWWKYKKYFSRYQITDILKRNGVLKKKGGAYNVPKESFVDNSKDFKYLTDAEIDFESEIKSKLF